MRRRSLLASMAAGTAGLAGCASLSASDDETGTNDDSNDTDTREGTSDDDGSSDDPPQHDVPDGLASVVDLGTIDRTYAFAPTSFRTDDDARIALSFDRTATAGSPVRLTGWLENANEYENTFDLEWIPAVGTAHSRTLSGYDHESRLHLAPTENNEIAETVPELTRDRDGLWQVTDVGPWMQEHVRLDPGERVQLEYAVVGESGTSGRPTGTYEFRGDDETVRIAVWNTDAPGPDVDSHFEGREIPPLRTELSVQWYHEADESTPAYLEPAAEHLELDGAIDFEFVYDARESTGCGHWNLYKLVDGEWFHVDPRGHLSDCRQIAPGERMDWTLRAFDGPAVGCGCDDGSTGCAGGLTRGYLGPGIYGVVVGYGHPAEESGALVELSGDRVPIEPTADATVERDSATVVVTTDVHGDGEHPPDATLTVERVGDADGSVERGDADDGDNETAPERVIAEQVMGGQQLVGSSSALRNGIAPFEEGVERVEVRTDEYTVDGAVGYENSSRRVALRGTVYRLTTERPAD